MVNNTFEPFNVSLRRSYPPSVPGRLPTDVILPPQVASR